ncbi:hypothetical protein [Lentzea guizhouensis]|uniref:hypothetical protein n=1 Tax=Lentzea guizhouensis TaxID=1586287 RepID=UPI0012B68EF4|nr:hypothetical protein [Lentzea guizhouensis]
MEAEDQYGNPAPALIYGPDAPRRDVRGYMQPHVSAEPAETGRQPVITRWRLFTYDQVGPREQAEWRGRTFRVDGTPEMWEPRYGRPGSGCGSWKWRADRASVHGLSGRP